MREAARRNGGYLLMLLFLIAICFYIWGYDGVRYGYEETLPDVENYQMLEIGQESGVSQEFVPVRKYLKSIQLLFVNLAEDGKGTIELELTDDKGNAVLKERMAVAEISAGQWTAFYGKARVSPEKVYSLQIRAQDCSIQPYVLIRETAENPELALSNDGQAVEGSVLFGYGYAVPASTWEKTVLSLMAAACGILFCFFMKGRRYFSRDLWDRISFGATKEKGRKCVTAVLFGISFLLLVPDIIYRLENLELDPSWRYFLNMAAPEGLKFGKDVFFTYGPLGYLIYLMKLPENTVYFWLGVLIWAAVIGLHLYLLFRLYQLVCRKKLGLVPVVISTLCLIAAYHAVERDNYLLYLLVLSVVAFFLGAKAVWWIPDILLVLMFFGKFSTFTSGLAFCVLFVLFDILFNRRWKSLGLCLPAFVCMPVLYLVYCPSIESLWEYVSGIFIISDGWMQTQQFNQTLNENEIIWMAAIMLAYASLVLISVWNDYRTSCVMLACSASMFFVYKYAITRHGLNPGLWLFGMLFSALMLGFDWKGLRESCRKKRRASGVLCLGVFLAVALTGMLQVHSLQTNAGYIKEQLASKGYSWTHLGEDCIPEEVVSQNRLPEDILLEIGSKTVTVYPWRTAYRAVHPELNMVYYPSVQNVNENTPWLDEKVAEWFTSEEAAQYILLTDETIDGHIKYWDNPLTWEAIKANYSVKRISEDICLLERDGESPSSVPELKLVNSGVYQGTDTIICPEDADYVKITLQLSGMGKLKKFFYRVGEISMSAACTDGSSFAGRVMVPNLPSGFALVRPPQDLYEMEAVLNDGEQIRIESFSFWGEGMKDMEGEIFVEWYCYE